MGHCILRRGERQCGLGPAPVNMRLATCVFGPWTPYYYVMPVCSTQASSLLSTICIGCIETGCACVLDYSLDALAGERTSFLSAVPWKLFRGLKDYHSTDETSFRATRRLTAAQSPTTTESCHVTVPQQAPNLHTICRVIETRSSRPTRPLATAAPRVCAQSTVHTQLRPVSSPVYPLGCCDGQLRMSQLCNLYTWPSISYRTNSSTCASVPPTQATQPLRPC